jgi:hypothetical protein
VQENNLKAKSMIAAMTLVTLPSLAAQPAPPVNIIFTAENASCAAWTKSAGNRLVRAQYEFWARGFVSGHNYANPAHQVKVGVFPGGDDLYQYFDQYCRDNPQQSFVEGTMHLVDQLLAAPAPKKPAPGKPAADKNAPAAR